MAVPRTLICILFVWCYHTVSAVKNCSDCVPFFDCPGAITFMFTHSFKQESTQEIIIASHCGRYYEERILLDVVCCQDFAPGKKLQPPPKGVIESHPNAHLLPKACGYFDSDRTIPGSFVNLYEFPWMALISVRTSLGRAKLRFVCSGSIINNRYILTAAHCVARAARELTTVRIGENNLATKIDCQGDGDLKVCESYLQDIGVEDIILHKDFNRRSAFKQNNIALIRLEKAVNFTHHDNAAIVCLPVTDDLLNSSLAGKMATVTGWELIRRNPSILRRGNAPIIKSAVCHGNGMEEPEEKVICANSENNTDICKGDGGSPLVVEEYYQGFHRYFQYGILSRGPRHCGTSRPEVYTDVTQYMGWILDHIKP